MSKIHVGSTKVMIVENQGGRAMSAEAYSDRLQAVLAIINNGAIGGGIGYGCDEHKSALDEIEKQIEQTRSRFAEIEANKED